RRPTEVYHCGAAGPTRTRTGARSVVDDSMLDLGTSFLASVARDPLALAIVDAEVRLSYRDWYRNISALVAAFDQLGLRPGAHPATALTKRWEAAPLHGAAQLAGIIIPPLNWRCPADALDFCLGDAEAKAVVYEPIAAAAVRASQASRGLARIAVGCDGGSD